MALIKDFIDVPFVGGIDTKTDSKRVMPTKLLALQNATFASPGKLKKRYGATALSASILGGGIVAAGSALMTRASELLLADGTSLYSYNQANAAWQSKGVLPSVTVTTQPIAVNQYSIAGYDTAINGNLLCSVFEKWSGGFYGTYIGADYSVTDTATGQVVFTGSIASPGGLAANAANPRVVALGSNFLIYYVDTSAAPKVLHVVVVATTAPQTIVSDTALTSGAAAMALASSNQVYDATVASSIAYIAFVNATSAPGGITVFGCLSASPATITYTKSVANAGAANSKSVCIFPDLFSGGPVIGYNNTGPAAILFAAFNTTLASTLGSGTVEDATGGVAISNNQIVCGVSTSAAAVAFTFFYANSQQFGSLDLGLTRVNTIGAAYAVGTPASYLRGVQPVGAPFYQNATVYVPLAFDTSLRPSPDNIQSTYFVADAAGNVVARFYAGTAGGYYTNQQSVGNYYVAVPHTVSLGSNKWILPAVNAYRFITQGSQFYFVGALYGATLTFADATYGWSRAALANSLHIGGGAMQVYDGAGKIVEVGFNWYPYAITSVVAGGGSIAAATYQYAVCYEWTDGYGQTHRSAPSVAISVVVGIAAQQVTLTIPTLRLTAKQGARQVLITVYRTAGAGSIFYQVNNLGNSAASILLNSTTADTVAYVDKLADASITGNPQLYTTGNVVADAPPPPLAAATVHRNRIIGIDATNRLSLPYSKQVIPGAPVEFSAFLAMNIDPRGGDATAVASLDDKLIVFKADRAFVVTGQGPDSTGGQNDFSDPVLLTSDCGCAAPRSIVTVPDGLMFKSAKGFYLLGRDLHVEYIGAEVEAYNSQSATSAVLMPGTNHVRFTLSGGPTLVYDYFVKQWAVFSTPAAVDSAIWQSTWVHLTSAGSVNQESAAFLDGAAVISLDAKTAWLSFAKVQGYQRIYKVLVLGTFKSAHTLTVTLRYNFVETPEVHTFTVGSDPGPYEFRVSPHVQRCTSIQVEVSDTSTGGSNESCDLSGLAFELGVLRGARRLPPGQAG